jgi:hypothetical protein
MPRTHKPVHVCVHAIVRFRERFADGYRPDEGAVRRRIEEALQRSYPLPGYEWPRHREQKLLDPEEGMILVVEHLPHGTIDVITCYEAEGAPA